jgi:hypothetical protein
MQEFDAAYHSTKNLYNQTDLLWRMLICCWDCCRLGWQSLLVWQAIQTSRLSFLPLAISLTLKHCGTVTYFLQNCIQFTNQTHCPWCYKWSSEHYIHLIPGKGSMYYIELNFDIECIHLFKPKFVFLIVSVALWNLSISQILQSRSFLYFHNVGIWVYSMAEG